MPILFNAINRLNKQNKSIYFIFCFAAPLPPFGHCCRDSLSNPMFLNLLGFRVQSCRESRNKIRSLRLHEIPEGFENRVTSGSNVTPSHDGLLHPLKTCIKLDYYSNKQISNKIRILKK